MNFFRNSRCATCISHASLPSYYAVSSSGYPLIRPNLGFIASKFHLLYDFSFGWNLFFHSDSFRRDFRLYSTSVAVNNDGCMNKSEKNAANLGDCGVSSSVIKAVVDIVKDDAVGLECKLDLVGLNLSKRSIIEVLRVLNRLKVPALRFFDWARNVHSKYSRNADICSLVIVNCGVLGDYSALRSLLRDFRDKNISLSEQAFEFLNFSDGSNEAAKKSVAEIVGLLNEVGGSCRSSGIHSLITMLCSLNVFDLAKFVIENTEKRPSYYNVLVKHLCVKGHLEVAQDLLAEMSRQRRYADTTAYNYLISSLCVRGRIDEACCIPKVMIGRCCSPNELTYEILIYFTCRHGRLEDAGKFYNEMVSSGIKPRFPTYSAFIRGYISARRFDEAYRYVADSAEKDKWSASHMYTVLTSLHIEHGNLVVAHKLLLEMFEKGLVPKFSIYRRASKRLHKAGLSELAKMLDDCYSSSARKPS